MPAAERRQETVDSVIPPSAMGCGQLAGYRVVPGLVRVADVPPTGRARIWRGRTLASLVLADKSDPELVNGPRDDDLDWDAIVWRPVAENVQRLRPRILKASQEGDLKRVRNRVGTSRTSGG